MELPVWTLIPANFLVGLIVYFSYQSREYPMTFTYFITFQLVTAILILLFDFILNLYQNKKR